MNRLVIFLGLPFTSSLCFADDVIQGHYCYTYGDRESLQEARELTRSLAIRNAIESYRAFITSTSTVKNFQLKNDLVQMISSGYLKDIRVVEHKEEGKTICETIQATVSPQAVEDFVKRAKERTEEIEEKGVANNGYLKILNVKTKYYPPDLIYGRLPFFQLLVVTKYLRKTTEEKLRTVFVDFYDSNGLPIDGKRESISANIYEGEMREIIFLIPEGTATYKTWLYQEK